MSDTKSSAPQSPHDPHPVPQPGTWFRLSTVFFSAVIAVAVIGYFVGIGAGVPHHDDDDAIYSRTIGAADDVELADPEKPAPPTPGVVDALSYAEVPAWAERRTADRLVSLEQLPVAEFDLFAAIEPSEEDKQRSAEIRAERRAYNGAPPVIPHAVEGTNDAACYQCHTHGVTIGDKRANLISHCFLANCTQCHSPPAPPPFADYPADVETSFVGMPAPEKGHRAYPGAPPTIPHSQWMRDNCVSCHSSTLGWPGMETTHPWRTNCTQCHAPSAELDQAFFASAEQMLTPQDSPTP